MEIIYVIVGAIIWAVILYSIIEGSTRSKKIERLLRIQCNLLAKIAEKQGIEDSEIQGLLKTTTLFEKREVINKYGTST